jgi:hypothetical protein
MHIVFDVASPPPQRQQRVVDGGPRELYLVAGTGDNGSRRADLFSEVVADRVEPCAVSA